MIFLSARNHVEEMAVVSVTERNLEEKVCGWFRTIDAASLTRIDSMHARQKCWRSLLLFSVSHPRCRFIEGNAEGKPSSIPEERKGQATKVCGSPENGAGRGEGRYSPGKLRFDPEASERSRANSHSWRRELGEETREKTHPRHSISLF